MNVAHLQQVKPDRDYRLDFCRGLALIVIFIDHVPGNPAANWTLRNFGFCDAAEIFVLISGISTYLAYAPKFDRLGLAGCAAAVGRRWLKLYSYHIGLFFITAAVICLAFSLSANRNYIQFLNFNWFFADPWSASFAALSLRYLPRFLDILPLYLLLLAAAPVLIQLVKYDVRVAIITSVVTYTLAWIGGFNLSAGNDGSQWYFNPLAWQLLYTGGIVIGHLAKTSPAKIPRDTRWAVLATGFILFAAFAALRTNLSCSFLATWNPLLNLWPAEKTFLSPLRVLNVFALAYAFSFAVSAQAWALKTAGAAPFVTCGRHSLETYCIGVVLAVGGYVAVAQGGGGALTYVAVNIGGAVGQFLIAGMFERWRVRRAQRDSKRLGALRVPGEVAA
jgi:hypothetical protein